MKCYFCEEKERVSYFSYYCKDCAMLRRWMLTYSPSKCCDILKKTLTRDDKQIDFKIQQEVKKLVNNQIETNDHSYITTRSKSKSTTN